MGCDEVAVKGDVAALSCRRWRSDLRNDATSWRNPVPTACRPPLLRALP
jgi:hypothetical protein